MPSTVSEIPIIGITMGDAAGIGPEIVLKALSDENLRRLCRCIIIGDVGYLRATASSLAIDFALTLLNEPSSSEQNSVEVFDLENLSSEFAIGVDAAQTGKASAEYIEAAVDLWRRNKIDAICTAPISKKALSLGGYDFPGHTEFLATLSGTRDFAMSFFGGNLRVVLLSTHLPIRKAIDLVKKDRLIELLTFSHRELGKLLGKDVKLAVAGLNPHASEGGMFGNEERDEIIPAIEDCRSNKGINVSGPYSPDTIFLRASAGEFDAVVSLYHDQATIAVKSMCFGSAVNVTLGLPFVRTSVDHGTAFDIAGRGIADASSMTAAIRLAAELAASSRDLSGI